MSCQFARIIRPQNPYFTASVVIVTPIARLYTVDHQLPRYNRAQYLIKVRFRKVVPGMICSLDSSLVSACSKDEGVTLLAVTETIVNFLRKRGHSKSLFANALNSYQSAIIGVGFEYAKIFLYVFYNTPPVLYLVGRPIFRTHLLVFSYSASCFFLLSSLRYNDSTVFHSYCLTHIPG